MSQNVTKLQPNLVERPSKAAQFRQMLTSPDLEFIMEAHNGLSAKIVEETGLKGIWASGLTISSALGVRDSNEASWTQVLEVVEFMSDASSNQIMLDGDTGWSASMRTCRQAKRTANGSAWLSSVKKAVRWSVKS